MSPIRGGYFTQADLYRKREDGITPLITLDMVCEANEDMAAEAERERRYMESVQRK